MAEFSDRLIDRLADAKRVAVLTGAGISAESGIPTFRDPDGLWQKYRPEDLATVDALIRNPALVQSWYGHRRKIIREKAPNPGHLALAELEELAPDFTLITQNVDGLHQRAGSRCVLELHGNLLRNYCVECRKPADEAVLDSIADGEPSRCVDCSGFIRPDVVWFGEMLPMETYARAETAAMKADVFLSVGTSGVVYPAAGIPILARESGAFVVEINVEPSALAAYMSEVIIGRAGETLPEIVTELKKRRKSAARP